MEMLGRVVKGFLVAGMVVTLGILRLSFAFLRVQQQFSAFPASRIPAGNDAARLLQRYAHPGKRFCALVPGLLYVCKRSGPA